MTDVTRIISQIEGGDPSEADRLLPLVYEELRKLAAARLAHQKPGHTLQATALVHEAFLRLIGDGDESRWNSRGHFFAAAAEAMRRILIESARRKKSLKAGGAVNRISIHENEFTANGQSDDLLSLDEALQKLEQQSPRKAQVVKLRFFAGLTISQTAEALGIAPSTAIADWSYSKGWLKLEISRNL